MEKITKSTDTVLIDPNEPLILPDGTALVGRIEWFLYALCCLDYQNLPTPMSRIEEFANALITGEIPNIEPQSRAEQFFLAILDGNISNLPQPQSRSEILLDKLARGEFDLSDVEPIQTHYELLLAYLIKNGGIGNIDYVLYEFSEAMKTMYNTVEKPFKSLELSGNTLVNCVLEDTENDDYTSFDKDYSGTSFTINGTSEGAIKSAILKGNTLVNLCDKTKSVFSLDGNKNLWQNVLFNTNPTQLTVINHTDKVIKFTLHNRTTDNWVSTTGVEANSKSLVNCGTNNYLKDLYGAYNDGWSNTEEDRNILKDGILILEGDYTNVNIPYFEGMQSVKMPVLCTIGKNLLKDDSWESGYINVDTGINETSVNHSRYNDFIPINAGDVFSFSSSTNVWRKYFLYDSNKKFLQTFPAVSTKNLVINIENTQAKYMRIWIQQNIDSLDNDIQLEHGSNATTYEPYKSNILTTTSKNLFDMNRPYDAITDSQATVVQDTNQITVSSAESGIYVNANFILDKDFFAGKTVTGSCLYESDEKDIGTVQIYYQDGNGEHHYQWIRTPRTFTFPNSFIGDVMLCVSANNTGTPQSNTVTVKNIQLELGSTATSYEPYSEVVLRGIGDVQDTLDLTTGELTQRIGEVVLDGSDDEEWNAWITEETMIVWTMPKSFVNLINPISDRYISSTAYGKTEEMFAINSDDTRHIQLRLFKTTARNINELKIYLQSNPITVQYKLETPTIKTVDLNVVDQNNTEIDKIHVFNETTHVNASSDELTPTVNIGKSVSYPTIIKPNTKYTVDLKRNDKSLTVNLGGTEVTFVDGETRKIITTPSTLTNDKLSYYGIGAKCNKIMLIEGEVEGNVDYFTGMQSVVMQNQMPILSTVGKNLFDKNKLEKGEIHSDGELVVNDVRCRTSDFIQVNSGSKMTLSKLTKQWFRIFGYDKNKNLIDNTIVNNRSASETFTVPSNVCFIKIKFDYTVDVAMADNIQLEYSTQQTSYEPHKTSILSCNDDVTLRGIGDVKDELDLLTGEMIQRIGEVVLDGSDDEEYSKEITSSGIVRFNFSGNTNNITQKSKPHGQALCDKLITSNKDIDNLDYVKVHSNNGGFWVYQADKDLDANTLKEKLKINPLTIKYQLATESIKTVDSNVVDQDGNTIPKIKSYDGVTHLEVTVPKQSLLPNISAEVATDNSKDMSLLTIKHQEISEAQSTIEDSIQFQSDEIDTALMATTEIFESILE